MSKEHIIHFSADGLRIVGTLHLPDASPAPPVIIGCHGLMADRQSPKQIALARACNQAGIAYLRFDHRGCGDSEGNFDEVTSLEARSEDLNRAIDTVAAMDALGPLMGLFGSSFGGTTVLNVASRRPVPALVTFAAPIESRSIHGSAVAAHPPRSKALERALNFDITSCLDRVDTILVAHGRDDEIVPVSHAEIIHQRVGAPKDLILQPGGDHRMTDPVHQQSFQERFLGWFQEHGRRTIQIE